MLGGERGIRNTRTLVVDNFLGLINVAIEASTRINRIERILGEGGVGVFVELEIFGHS